MQSTRVSDTSFSQSANERRRYGSEAVVNIIDYMIKVGLAGHQMWGNDQAEEKRYNT